MYPGVQVESSERRTTGLPRRMLNGLGILQIHVCCVNRIEENFVTGRLVVFTCHNAWKAVGFVLCIFTEKIRFCAYARILVMLAFSSGQYSISFLYRHPGPSGRWMDGLGCLVRLLFQLWARNTNKVKVMHQPGTSKWRSRLCREPYGNDELPD